jgi:hypothetical protein
MTLCLLNPVQWLPLPCRNLLIHVLHKFRVGLLLLPYLLCRDLRTNLPRELMGFSDLPFTPGMMGAASSNARRFCSHEEVSWQRCAARSMCGIRPLCCCWAQLAVPHLQPVQPQGGARNAAGPDSHSD